MRKLKKNTTLCNLNADYNTMYCTVVVILSGPMYPLRSANVPLGVHVPQVGNPCPRERGEDFTVHTQLL